MISPEIAAAGMEFRDRWCSQLPPASPVQLDFSWPSIGTLELMLCKYRDDHRVDAAGQKIIRGAAAYLAIVAEMAWKLFDPNVRVEFGPYGITLFAERAPGGNEVQLELRLEDQLVTLLREPPRNLAVLPGFSRMFNNEHSLLSPFGLGVMLGISPYMQPHAQLEYGGVWNEHMRKAICHLAQSSAAWYTRCFPNEPVGQNELLYQSSLIFPPLFFGETIPAFQATRGLIGHLRNWSLTPQEMLVVCRNLVLCPDELISLAAIAVYAALSEHLPPAQTIAAAQGKGRSLGLLRRTMLAARAELDLPGDWLLSSHGRYADAERFEIEQSMGLLPWIYMDARRVGTVEHDKNLREILLALAGADLEYARLLIDRTVRQHPDDIDMRLQKAYIFLALLDTTSADEELEAIGKREEVLDNPRYYDLKGCAAMNKNDLPGAVESFKRALELCRRSDGLRAGVIGNYSAALIRTGDYSKAMWVLNIGARECASAVWLLMQKSFLFFGYGMKNEQEQLERRLVELAPLDRRVASLYCDRAFPAEAPIMVPQDEHTAGPLSIPMSARA